MNDFDKGNIKDVKVPQSTCTLSSYLEPAWTASRPFIIVSMTAIESIFFAITMFYFIATVIDLLAYSNGLPSHQILCFAPMAFAIAIIPSIFVCIGSTYIKSKNLDYTTDSANGDNQAKTSPAPALLQKKKTPLERIGVKAVECGFALRAVFETAGAAFWLVSFLYDGIENFFMGKRVAIFFLLLVCIVLGILRSIAVVRAYKNTVKKSQQASNTENEATQDNGEPDIWSYISLGIGFLLTSMGCLSIHSKNILSWIFAMVIAISAVCAEYRCTYAKLCINKTKSPDKSKINPKATSWWKFIIYVMISAWHNVAHFIQKTLPACLPLQRYFIEHHYFPQKYLSTFWIGIAIPALIWASISVKDDLFNLRELDRRKELNKESNTKSDGNLVPTAALSAVN